MKQLSFFLILYSQTFNILAQAQEPDTSTPSEESSTQSEETSSLSSEDSDSPTELGSGQDMWYWLNGQWHPFGGATGNLFGFEDFLLQNTSESDDVAEDDVAEDDVAEDDVAENGDGGTGEPQAPDTGDSGDVAENGDAVDAKMVQVTSPNDDGEGSLRQIIANSQDGDIITFSDSQNITVVSPITIDKDIVIDGGDKITISGGEQTAIFKIIGGNVEIRNIILKDGLSQGGNGQGPIGKGANRYFWDNEIESGPGGGGAGMGGALAILKAHVKLEGVSFINNKAIGGKGGYSKHSKGSWNGFDYVQYSGGGGGSIFSSGAPRTPWGNDANGRNGGLGAGGGGSMAYYSNSKKGGVGGFGGGGGGGDGGTLHQRSDRYSPGIGGSSKGFGGNGADGSNSGQSGGGGGGAGLGGAIYIHEGSLTIKDSNFEANYAIGGVGGNTGANDGGVGGNGQGVGGAIFVYQDAIFNDHGLDYRDNYAQTSDNDFYIMDVDENIISDSNNQNTGDSGDVADQAPDTGDSDDVADQAPDSGDSGDVADQAPDTTVPVITLVGDVDVTIYSGNSYTDAGATASDNIDGDITSSISVDNPVDPNAVGTYTVTYNVSDSAANAATQVTRTVNVLPQALQYLTYGIDENSITITDCDTAASGELIIPSTIEDRPVTSIGDYAFRSCTSLTSIIIPSSVTTIARYAFFNCSGLTSITIPSSVTSIGESAFRECSDLTNITIPENVTSIRKHTFRSCTSLTSIAIPSSVTSIGESAFRECSDLTNITIPESVTSIGDYAFRRCTSLTSVNISSSVTSIGQSAFRECSSLTSITIPSSVISIGQSAFRECSRLMSIIYRGSTAPSLGANVFEGINSEATFTAPSDAVGYGSTFAGIKKANQTAPDNGDSGDVADNGDGGTGEPQAPDSDVDPHGGPVSESFGDVVVYPNNSATLVGQVTIEGEVAGIGDVVAIYVGSELRGKQEVIINGGVAWVNAQVNAAGGDETISFKVYDASTGVTHEKSRTSAVITTGGIVGSPASPLMIEMKDFEIQTLNLKAGWNLVSFYVEADDMTPASVFAPIEDKLMQVKNLTQSYDPSNPLFLNTLSSLNVKDGYWLNVIEDVNLDVQGQVPLGASINVKSGWNLVGYPRLSGETVANELASLGDTVIQIKDLESSYDPNNPPFLNTLSTMAPGSGYWLNVDADGTWELGTVEESQFRSLGDVEPRSDHSPEAKAGPSWGQAMVYPNLGASVLAKVSIQGKPVAKGGVVAAFVGNELRGVQDVVLHEGMSYVTLNINLNGAESVSYRVWNPEDHNEYLVSGTMLLELGSMYGKPELLELDGVRFIGKPPRVFNITSEPFGFSFNTTVGRSYTVEVTRDLQRWKPVQLFHGSGGEIRFTAKPTFDNKPQFYRIYVE